MVPPCSPLPPRRLMGEVPQLQGRSATTPALPEGDFRHQVTIAKAPRSRGRACVCKHVLCVEPCTLLSQHNAEVHQPGSTHRAGWATNAVADSDAPATRAKRVPRRMPRTPGLRKKELKTVKRSFSTNTSPIFKKIRSSCASRAVD